VDGFTTTEWLVGTLANQLGIHEISQLCLDYIPSGLQGGMNLFHVTKGQHNRKKEVVMS